MIYNYTEFNESNGSDIKKVSFGNYTILVGKSAKSNDIITLEMSVDGDIFLHAKGVPGAHVLIKSKPNEVVPKDVIQKAAELAAKNSKSKEPIVTVVYCKKMFVSKDPGMPDGKVNVDYKNANEIDIKN
jgi:predicted ribosome quality control (RQC) complex YloA/Tae2 family protein